MIHEERRGRLLDKSRFAETKHNFRCKRAYVYICVAYIHADMHIYWKNLCRELRASNNMPLLVPSFENGINAKKYSDVVV